MVEALSIASELLPPTGVALIGAGHHERSHGPKIFERLSHLGRLVAVAEPYEPRRAELSYFPEYRDIPILSDWREVMRMDKVEAVIIASRDKDHFRQANFAINYAKKDGLHVLLEKPVVNTQQEAEALPGLLRAAREKGRVLMPCLAREFGQPGIAVNALVHDRRQFKHLGVKGDLGNILSITFTCNYTGARETPQGEQPLHTSFAIDKSAHDINSAHQLTGATHLRHASLDVDDEKGDRFSMHMLGVTKDGQEIDITSRGSRRIPRNFYARNFPELGWDDRGIYNDTLQIDFAQGEMRASSGFLFVRWGEDEVTIRSPRLMLNYDDQFTALNRHFLERVRGGADVPPRISDEATLLSGLTIIQLQQAMGRLVDIPPPSI